MKQEHIVAFGGTWYHFYVDSAQGFRVGKKQGARFYSSECLLKDAFYDFSVVSAEKTLHAVCQDARGTIWYFLFDGSKWHSRPLLESRDKSAEYKNLTLVANSDFINLFYAISAKEQTMLVHQLLGRGAKEPMVADYITGTEFSVCSHTNGDCTVLYHNADNVLGTKRLRWSKKAFEAFVPLDCGCDLTGAALVSDENDHLNIAAYATFDKFVNILFLNKNTDTGDCTLSAVHLVSGTSEGLALSRSDTEFRISWCENGLVMASFRSEQNRWSAPKKYIRGTTCENVLYHIENGTERFSTYGYFQDGRIMLYITRDLLDHPPKATVSPAPRAVNTSALGTSSAGAEGASAKEKRAPQTNPFPESKPAEFVKRSVYLTDMAAVRKLLAGQNDVVVEMLKKITALERAIREREDPPISTDKGISAEELTEDPNAIDRLAAENAQEDSNETSALG